MARASIEYHVVHRIEDHAILRQIAWRTIDQLQRLLLQRRRIAVRIWWLSGECGGYGDQAARNERGTPWNCGRVSWAFG